MNIACFFLKETGRARVSLRRYQWVRGRNSCTASGAGYHNAEVTIGECAVIYREDGTHCYPEDGPGVTLDDPRWPTRCACGYEFVESDERQISQHLLYVREDTGEEFTRPHTFPAGALWHADWHLPWIVGPDGHCLCVMTPGGEWMIDSEANNCTRPGDKTHHCWVRHGEVPLITVDKNGDTCAAGAGSIMCGNYHGFLRNGILEDC